MKGSQSLSQKTLLRLDNILLTYGQIHALKNINLFLRSAEIHAIVEEADAKYAGVA